MITSYLTPSEAEVLLDQLLEVNTFSSYSEEEKQRALNSATMAFNNLVYTGTKSVDAQSNEFPRNGDATPPDDFLLAVAIEAYSLIDGKSPETEWSVAWMSGQDFAGVSSRYDRSSKEPNIINGIMSVQSWRLVKKYLADYQTITLENS